MILGESSKKSCPSCANKMKRLESKFESVKMELDSCQLCYLLWFDADELKEIQLKLPKDWPKEKGPQVEAYRSLLSARIPYQQRCMHLLCTLMQF